MTAALPRFHLLLASLLAVTLAGCRTEAKPQVSIRPVVTEVVALQTIQPTASYPGEVKARHESDLAFRVGGKIISRSVDVGDRVSTGQVLARLDPQDAELAVQAAQAQVAAAAAEVELTRAELERYGRLRERQLLGQSDLDVREHAHRAATARLNEAQAGLEIARHQHQYAELVSVGDGVITAVAAEPGQVVTAGQTVARIARLDEREVLVHVPESRIAAARSAMAVTVRLWAYPDHAYRGEIREIAPMADAVTRTFAIRVRVIDADEMLALGMTTNVGFAGATPETRVALLPSTSILEREGRISVLTVDPETTTITPRQVEIVGFAGDRVAVAGSLAEGDRIVTAGVHKLRPGERVRLLDSATASPGRG